MGFLCPFVAQAEHAHGWKRPPQPVEIGNVPREDMIATRRGGRHDNGVNDTRPFRCGESLAGNLRKLQVERFDVEPVEQARDRPALPTPPFDDNRRRYRDAETPASRGTDELHRATIAALECDQRARIECQPQSSVSAAAISSGESGRPSSAQVMNSFQASVCRRSRSASAITAETVEPSRPAFSLAHSSSSNGTETLILATGASGFDARPRGRTAFARLAAFSFFMRADMVAPMVVPKRETGNAAGRLTGLPVSCELRYRRVHGDLTLVPKPGCRVRLRDAGTGQHRPLTTMLPRINVRPPCTGRGTFLA